MDQVLSESLGWLALRCTAGILFFFQGYDKLFKVGIEKAAEALDGSLNHGFLNRPSWRALLTLSSCMELIGGVLLTLGLFRDHAAVVLGIDMVAVAFVFSAWNPMWDMQYFFPRFSMVIALLIIPSPSDVICLDSWLAFR